MVKTSSWLDELNNTNGANGKNTPAKNKIGGHENQHDVDESLDDRSAKVP